MISRFRGNERRRIPIRFKFFKGFKSPYGWSGNYPSWESAMAQCEGYDSDLILETVKQSLLKVKSGEFPYERDSVLFDKVEYFWPLLSGLMWVAAQCGGGLNIIDFGGSLGSTYFQNKRFIEHLKSVNWNIVEQEKFVRVGREFFESDELHFYDDIETCLIEKQPPCILFSSVIQYLEKPYDILEKVRGYGFEYIIFDRTSFLPSEEEGDRITVQRVPPQIYEASYPCWFLDETKFLDFFSGLYDLIADFKALDRANIPSRFKGFIFKRNAPR